MSRNTTYTQYRSRPPSRPQSEQLVDLHVYVVPPDVWRDRFNNFLNQAVIETVSLGIIRVPPEARLVEIRQELVQQLEDLVPQDYVFLRSVGRSITRLKAKQEYQYKVKHFVRPQAYADELYLLEATPDLVASFTSRSQSPQSSRHAGGSQGGSPRLHRTHGYRPPETYQGYDDRYTQTNDDYLEAGPAHTNRSQREPPFQHYSPLPKIAFQNGRDPQTRDPHSRDPHPRDPHPHHGYPDSSFPSDPYVHFSQPPDPSDPYSKRRERPPDPSYPHPDYPDAQQPGYGPRGEDPYEARGPQSAHRAPSRENTPTPDSPREGDRARGQPSGHAQSDAGRSPRALGLGLGGKNAPTSSTPPPLTERREGGGGKGARGDDPRAATYTTNTNEDSGVAGLSPDDNNDDLFDRRKKVQSQMDRDKADLEREEELERQRRLRDLGERDLLDRNNWEEDAEERRRRQEEERRRRLQEDADRKRQAANDERNRHAQSDDDDDNRNDRSKKDRDNKLRRGSSDEELNRYPSPPPETKTPTAARDTESARQSRKREKDKLLKELEAAKEDRKHAEKEREELVKKAKQLQNKTQNRRNHARDVWKKRYFEEKKKTSPLEDQTNKLRAELDSLHKKLMASLEGPKQQRGVGVGTGAPSQRNNYVIQCTKLQHEIEDLRRRVENAKMKLTAEMKLHAETEAEAKILRAELTKKKVKMHGHAFTQIY